MRSGSGNPARLREALEASLAAGHALPMAYCAGLDAVAAEMRRLGVLGTVRVDAKTLTVRT